MFCRCTHGAATCVDSLVMSTVLSLSLSRRRFIISIKLQYRNRFNHIYLFDKNAIYTISQFIMINENISIINTWLRMYQYKFKCAEIIDRGMKIYTIQYTVYQETCCSHSNRSTSSVFFPWRAAVAVWRSSGLGRVSRSKPLPPPGGWRLCPAGSAVLWPAAGAYVSAEWEVTPGSKVTP